MSYGNSDNKEESCRCGYVYLFGLLGIQIKKLWYRLFRR